MHTHIILILFSVWFQLYFSSHKKNNVFIEFYHFRSLYNFLLCKTPI